MDLGKNELDVDKLNLLGFSIDVESILRKNLSIVQCVCEHATTNVDILDIML